MTDETENTEETETETTVEEPENISDLFDDDKAEETESETETETEDESEKVATETEETETDEADTAETETETEETDSETTSEEDASVPRRALIDERRKRQEAQEELERLRQQYGATEEDAPDPTDDPQAYEQYLRTKWEKEQWEKTANHSREKMLEKTPDYEEKEQYFLQVLVPQDPELPKQMRADPDPASFAYNKAKESLDAQEQAIEQRVLERLKKEGKLKDDDPDKGKKPAASKVAELTIATAAGKNSDDEVVESENPEDVFGDELAY